MNDQQVRQTPITDLLRDIPADARMVYEVTPTHHQSVPVGVLAKNAADELERLRAALIAAMEIVQKDRLVLYRTALDPRTETVTDLYSLAALADYDRVIAQADAALGSE